VRFQLQDADDLLVADHPEEQQDTPYISDLKRMMLAIRTKSEGWTELCRSVGAKYIKADVAKIQAEMQTISDSEYNPAIVAVVDLLQQQSSISEGEVLAALSACVLLAIDG